MKLHLFAHNNKNFVKAGDKVKAYGDKIASVGTANGNYWAHLHYSISDGLTVEQILLYINGWSEGAVLEYYIDPRDINFKKMFGRTMDVGNAGYDWLQKISNGSPHPGVDVNGKGGGNSDLGYEFSSPVDGEVLYIDNTNANNGWGKLLVIKETMEKCYHITSDLEKELQKRDKKFDGDKKDDQKKMAEELRDERHRLEKLENQDIICEFGDYIIIKK